MRGIITGSLTALALGLAVGAAEIPGTQPSSQAVIAATTSQPATDSQPATTSQPVNPFLTMTIPGPPAPTADEFPRFDPGITDEQIVAAIKKGADYLLALRRDDNFEVFNAPWTKGPTERGGETALIVYALIAASESIDEPDFRKKTNFQSPELAPVIEYLKNVQPDGTYVAGLIACALTSLPKTPDIIAAMDRPNGPKAYLFRATNSTGGYAYSVPGAVIDAHIADLEQQLSDMRSRQRAPGKKDPNDVKALAEEVKNKIAEISKARASAVKEKQSLQRHWNPDGSNTQYGVLGAWAMAEFGINMPPGYWVAQDGYWRRLQLADGGFPYQKNAKLQVGRETMAPAGLASLYLTQEFLDVEPRLEPRIDKHMDAAVKHISENFNPKPNDQYYGYGIERVGVASGLKFFGTHEWYRELAEGLVKSQNADGSWAPGFYAGQANSQSISTCYSLLILRGRNPVLINKLDYGDAEGHWNNRSRDVARLTEKLAKSFERPLNWQIVTHNSKPEDWMDAPILFISGSKDPAFSAEDIEKLKAYVEMGGIIFSSADGESPEFTEAIRKVAAKIVPGREMRELPADHALFNGELWTKIPSPPKVLGLSNGVRELWIHSTADMGATWHKRTYDFKSHWDFPGNLYFYATGKANLKTRLQSLVVNLKPVQAAAAEGAPAADPAAGGAGVAASAPPMPRLLVGRLLLGDNPDPEPGAWPRMARLVRNACDVDMQVKIMTPGELAKEKPAAVHFTGTTPFTASDADLAALRNYLNSGGTLIADSAGMSPAFAVAFVNMCGQLYPKNALAPVATASVIYGGTENGAKPIQAVRYRPYYMLAKGIVTEAHLQGVRLTERSRYVILYSEEDITSGLLGTNTWGIMGYSPESARALARNMLLYAMHRAPSATTRPAGTPAAGPAEK